MTPTLEGIVRDLRESDRQERIELLLDLAKNLKPLPARLESLRDEAHRVPECQSPVFLFTELNRERLELHADAPIEAPTVRGFVALLIEGLDGCTVKELLEVPVDLIDRSGMTELLGMQRRSGLAAVLQQLKRSAVKAAAESAPTVQERELDSHATRS